MLIEQNLDCNFVILVRMEMDAQLCCGLISGLLQALL